MTLDLDITFIKGSKNSILIFAEYISNGKNLGIQPDDSSLKKKAYTLLICIMFWDNIFSSYVNIEAMNIISSDVEMN